MCWKSVNYKTLDLSYFWNHWNKNNLCYIRKFYIQLKYAFETLSAKKKKYFVAFFLILHLKWNSFLFSTTHIPPQVFVWDFFFLLYFFYAFSAYPVNDLKRHFKRSAISALGLCFQSIQAILDWNFLEYLSREKKYFFEQIVE